MTRSYESVLSNYKWKNTPNSILEIKYSFNNKKTENDENKIQILSFSEQDIVRSALKTWENLANIKFSEVFSVKDSNIAIYKSQFDEYKDSRGKTIATNGNTRIELNTNDTNYLKYAEILYNKEIFKLSNPGQEGYKTILHEIGHAIGLKHTTKNGEHDIGPFLDNSKDNQMNSIMSYSNIRNIKSFYPSIDNKYTEIYQPKYNKIEDIFYPSTPSIYDIAAIQKLYGENKKYNNGNSVYLFKDDLSHKKFHTIYDPEGQDTIDASQTSTDNLIDLRYGPYYASKIGNQYFRFAYNTKIEIVKSGSGNDVIYGTHSNVIHTGGGKDNIFVGTGENVIHLGTDNKKFIIDKNDIKEYASINHLNHFKTNDKIIIKNYKNAIIKLLKKDELKKIDIRNNLTEKYKLDQNYKIDNQYEISAINFDNVTVVLYGITTITEQDIILE